MAQYNQLVDNDQKYSIRHLYINEFSTFISHRGGNEHGRNINAYTDK